MVWKVLKIMFLSLAGVVATLSTIVDRLDVACLKQHQRNVKSDWSSEMREALTELAEILEDENNVSAFELHSSGLIQVMNDASI